MMKYTSRTVSIKWFKFFDYNYGNLRERVEQPDSGCLDITDLKVEGLQHVSKSFLDIGNKKFLFTQRIIRFFQILTARGRISILNKIAT